MTGGKLKRTRNEVAEFIENFLDGKGGPYDWDDFISIPISDPTLDQIRQRCARLDKEHPSAIKGNFCNEQGMVVLRDYVNKLRNET